MLARAIAVVADRRGCRGNGAGDRALVRGDPVGHRPGRGGNPGAGGARRARSRGDRDRGVVRRRVSAKTSTRTSGGSRRPSRRSTFRQARLTVDALRGGRSVPASPPMDSDFSRVQGADVILLFIESYGAVAFDRPDFAGPLEDARRMLDNSIQATGRHSVSAFVESPTFGGESWLAHISLMSGVEVRDPHTNAVLMTQHRETVVGAFSRHGYRTLANMPGLWWDWPEGSFYGFDDIYGALRLDYRGPQFGWFTLTDQFALARHRRVRDRAAAAAAGVRLLSDGQHARAVHADAALSAGLGTDVRRAAVRSRRARSQLRGGGRLARPRPGLRQGRRLLAAHAWPVTCNCAPIAISS